MAKIASIGASIFVYFCSPNWIAAGIGGRRGGGGGVGGAGIQGYAPDLNDSEIEEIGQDPFPIGYALADAGNFTVVTKEVSAPSKQRANRRVPDVCKTFWHLPGAELQDWLMTALLPVNYVPGPNRMTAMEIGSMGD